MFYSLKLDKIRCKNGLRVKRWVLRVLRYFYVTFKKTCVLSMIERGISA